MSQFRTMVEDKIEQILQQPKEKVLTDDIKAQVLEKVNDIEIDINSLSSAQYDSNPYGLEAPLAYGSGDYDYDEDEYYAKQIDTFIDYMKNDGIDAYIDLPPEKENDADYLKRLEMEIEAWLTELQPTDSWFGGDEDLRRDDR